MGMSLVIVAAQTAICSLKEFIKARRSMLLDKLENLNTLFAGMERALIAYSGGIDSTLVAKVAYDVLGDRALAVTAVSPSLLPEDLEDACVQAAEIGIAHELVQTHEMDNPNYTANPANRCYFCKSELHDTLKPLALERGYPYVVDGVNADDLSDYRPGIQAAKERGARSPLAEVGISKVEVREIAKHLGLACWDKPAQPCLSSRFPYGEEVRSPNSSAWVEPKPHCDGWGSEPFESVLRVILPASNCLLKS